MTYYDNPGRTHFDGDGCNAPHGHAPTPEELEDLFRPQVINNLTDWIQKFGPMPADKQIYDNIDKLIEDVQSMPAELEAFVFDPIDKLIEDVQSMGLYGDPTNPEYYKLPDGSDVYEAIKDMPYAQASALKYLFRAGKKGDFTDHLVDLKKALWFLEKEIARLEDLDG